MTDYNVILSNPSAFESLVAQLLLSDNETRKEAESVFETLKKAPDALVSNLVQVLRQSVKPEHRSFAAIMLRKVLTRDAPSLWSSINIQTQAIVKSELLHAIRQEQEKTVMRKVADTVSDLGGNLIPDNQWPELLPFLFECVQTNQQTLMESGLSIFSNLAEYAVDSLTQHMQRLHSMFATCLMHPLPDVKLAALRAVSSCIQSLDEPQQRDQFQDLIPAMLQCLGTTLAGGDETSAQDALEMFIEVAESHPKFLRKQLPSVVDAMLQIAMASQLEDATRQLAAEFLVTLCEARDKAPGMMRKLTEFPNKLFEVLMVFLLDVEDVPLWHNADSDQHEEEGSGELYDIGQECLDRVAIALGGNAILPAAGVVLPLWINDGDWKKRHASLICLAQIAEGCAKVMLKQLAALVEMCLKGLQDSHAKVRWAACQALGQMCTDLGPSIQEKCHDRILPALMAVMDDFNNPRVQAHASAAIVNFSENCEAEILAPYLDALITKLLVLLQQGKKLVQEGALTAMASVADAAQDLFVKYYDHVMPLLYQILVNATDKAHQLMRAKALECISLVGMAVGRDRFRSDASNVLQYLQQIQHGTLDANDPTTSYMLQAGARLCKCLKDEFIPYLHIVMPPLMKSAQLDPDVKVRDDDDLENGNDDEDEDDDDIERIHLGDKVLSIRTSNLEEKATACNMLCCYAEELKAGFFPYVKQVTDLMVPLLKFYFYEDVRRAAVLSLPELLGSAIAAQEQGVAGADNNFIQQMLEFMWGPWMAALGKEPDTDVLCTMLQSLSEVVDLVEPGLLKAENVESAFNQIDQILKRSGERRAERMKRNQAEDFDQEDLEALEQENEQEEELFDQAGTCIGSFLKKFGDAVLPYVERVMPHIAPYTEKGRSPEDRRIAICVVDDMLDHSPAGRQKYTNQVMPILLESATADHPDLRQCCAFGMAIVARKSPELFKPFAAEAIKRLVTVIRHPESRNDDNDMATENAIAALGHILENHGEVVDPSTAQIWVEALPLVVDAVEAHAMHELLVKRLEMHDLKVLGDSNKHLPHIVKAMVRVLGGGTELVTTEVAPRMVGLLHQFQHRVPAEVFQHSLAALTPKQQQAFQTYMSGQIPQS